MKMRAFFVLCLLLCAGCASVPSRPGCIKIGPFGGMCLLPPQALPTVQARHIVTIKHASQSDTFLGRLQVNASSLRLAGASMFGTHLFSIRWDGHAVVAEPPSTALRPELIVAMLEVALAEPELLRTRLIGITLSSTQNSHGDAVRELYEHGRLVARITIQGTVLAKSRLQISIPPAKLHLTLTPLPTTDPSAAP